LCSTSRLTSPSRRSWHQSLREFTQPTLPLQPLVVCTTFFCFFGSCFAPRDHSSHTVATVCYRDLVLGSTWFLAMRCSLVQRSAVYYSAVLQRGHMTLTFNQTRVQHPSP
jgi:hypothetical protein